MGWRHIACALACLLLAAGRQTASADTEPPWIISVGGMGSESGCDGIRWLAWGVLAPLAQTGALHHQLLYYNPLDLPDSYFAYKGAIENVETAVERDLKAGIQSKRYIFLLGYSHGAT